MAHIGSLKRIETVVDRLAAKLAPEDEDDDQSMVERTRYESVGAARWCGVVCCVKLSGPPGGGGEFGETRGFLRPPPTPLHDGKSLSECVCLRCRNRDRGASAAKRDFRWAPPWKRFMFIRVRGGKEGGVKGGYDVW